MEQPGVTACGGPPSEQIRRLWATHDTVGVSWSWAALTGLNNAAWLAHFTLERYWTALTPDVMVSHLGLLALT